MSEPKQKLFIFKIVFWAIALCFFVVTVLAVVLPNLVTPLASGGGLPRPCILNLREIDAAKNQWALENNKTNGTLVMETDIKPYIKLDKDGKLPECPQGGIYSVGKVGEPPTCSLGKTNPAHVLP